MIDNLAEALRALKDGGADEAPVLAADEFAARFHGLTLDQVVTLTGLPALAVTAMLRTPQGAAVERCLVDGRAGQSRQALARRLLLDAELDGEAVAREVLEFEAGVLRDRLVRDRDDMVYRASDGRPVVDADLTAVLRGRHHPAPPAEAPEHVGGPIRPVTIDDPVAFSGAVGEMLQGLAALHAGNRTAFGALRTLAAGANRDDADAVAAIEALAAGAEQVEAVVARLQRQATTLLRLVDGAAASAEPQL
jgi:hypothetical protein